jgi:hypothetical protein
VQLTSLKVLQVQGCHQLPAMPEALARLANPQSDIDGGL